MIPTVIKKSVLCDHEVNTIKTQWEYETIVFNDKTGLSVDGTQIYSHCIESALEDHNAACVRLEFLYGKT